MTECEIVDVTILHKTTQYCRTHKDDADKCVHHSMSNTYKSEVKHTYPTPEYGYYVYDPEQGKIVPHNPPDDVL